MNGYNIIKIDLFQVLDDICEFLFYATTTYILLLGDLIIFISILIHIHTDLELYITNTLYKYRFNQLFR